AHAVHAVVLEDQRAVLAAEVLPRGRSAVGVEVAHRPEAGLAGAVYPALVVDLAIAVGAVAGEVEVGDVAVEAGLIAAAGEHQLTVLGALLGVDADVGVGDGPGGRAGHAVLPVARAAVGLLRAGGEVRRVGMILVAAPLDLVGPDH